MKKFACITFNNIKFGLVCAFAFAAWPASGETITLFQASMESSTVRRDGNPVSTDAGTGFATFTLTEPDAGETGETTLAYEITLNGFDLDGLQTPGVTDDDVTAIHIHNLNLLPDLSPNTLGDTAGTQHVLNVFGVPRGGDDNDDMMFDAALSQVTGIWEDTDADPLLSPAPTQMISEFTDELAANELYVMIHTTAFPGGAIGGTIQLVPEPSSWLLMGIGFVLLARGLKRPRSRSHG